MTHLVGSQCIKCKYTDCVSVCPVDCFYEDEHMLAINPEECIDCGVCIEECPVYAIHSDRDVFDNMTVEDIVNHVDSGSDKKKFTPDQNYLYEIYKENVRISEKGDNITEKKDPLDTAEKHKDIDDKFIKLNILRDILKDIK